MKRLSNISRADWLLVAATVVAGLRMMLIHAVFIGFDLAQWPWFKGAEVWSGLAFAVLEGVALAYVSRLWVGLRPARAIDWVYWSILALGMAVMLASVIGVTSYAASSVRREAGIDALLGNGQAVAWSMFVTALNPLMVILIGIARAIDPREQAPARPTWPPLEVQLDLFVQQLGEQVITPDEAARRFEKLTGLSIATRQVASALAARDAGRRNVTAENVAQSNLPHLTARVDASLQGDTVTGDDVLNGPDTKTLTIRNRQAGTGKQASAGQQSGAAGKPVQGDALPVDVRRARVRELAAAGVSQAEIGRRLGINASTVRRDLEAVRREAKIVQGNGKVKVV